MKMILKEWALRHDFGHHSNPKSKDRAKIFFDKCFLRPSVNEAWEVLKSDTNDIQARKRAKAIIDSLDPRTMEAITVPCSVGDWCRHFAILSLQKTRQLVLHKKTC